MRKLVRHGEDDPADADAVDDPGHCCAARIQVDQDQHNGLVCKVREGANVLTVLGSINVDISVRVPRFAGPGETLLGGEARISPGGKGANQAHAARLFGADVAMIGAVGQDDLATTALALMRLSGVDVSGIRHSADATTGIATIHVADDAENSIVVAPGANFGVRAAWLEDALLRRSSALLLQMEIPAAESMIAARRAKMLGCQVTLNLAPALSISEVDFEAIDTLVVNESELAGAAAVAGGGGSDLAEQIARLSRRWQIDVIVTLGARGAIFHGRDDFRIERPAYAAQVIDTTGAGDTFTGVYTAARADGAPPGTALTLAITAAGLACGRRGAQMAQPTKQEIDRALPR